jgi:hypothetical protein
MCMENKERKKEKEKKENKERGMTRKIWKEMNQVKHK